MRQLEIVLDPQMMQLRRLVIGEVARFPELAKVRYERGPARAIRDLATVIARFVSLGRRRTDDRHLAATHLNWLVMSAPINQAMLLGDDAIPDQVELRRTAGEGIRVFLAGYGVPS